MRRANPELLLLLFLLLISAMLNYVAASQRMALVFYFLPTLYSAYHFGRRHATLTACASVFVVVLLTYLNPAMLSHHVELPFDTRWFDLTVWGGILIVTSYAMGTLYERNQKTLNEVKSGYDAMLAILQHFLASEKYSPGNSYRVSLYASKIGEAMGLDADSIEDVRTAALLRNLNELGVSNDVLYRAASVSREEIEKKLRKQGKILTKGRSKGNNLGGSMQRVIPIFAAEQLLLQTGGELIDAPVEVQVLAVAEAYEGLISAKGRNLPPAQASDIIVKSSGKKYDSMVVDAFVKAVGTQAKPAGAGA